MLVEDVLFFWKFWIRFIFYPKVEIHLFQSMCRKEYVHRWQCDWNQYLSFKDGYLQIQTNVSHIEMVIGIPMCTYNFLWGKKNKKLWINSRCCKSTQWHLNALPTEFFILKGVLVITSTEQIAWRCFTGYNVFLTNTCLLECTYLTI